MDGIGADLISFAVFDDGGFLLGKKAHFVDNFLGAELVDDADESVRDGDTNEKHIFVAADESHHES